MLRCAVGQHRALSGLVLRALCPACRKAWQVSGGVAWHVGGGVGGGALWLLLALLHLRSGGGAEGMCVLSPRPRHGNVARTAAEHTFANCFLHLQGCKC